MKSLYKKILKTAAACILFAAILSACQRYDSEEPKKETLTRINDKEITIDEFEGVLKRLLLDSDISSLSEDERKEFKRNILSQIIEEELILGEAKKIGIEVSDKEASKEIEEIRGDYEGDAFENIIASRYGNMEKWKEEIKRKILIRKAIDSIITSNVHIKNEEIEAYYIKHKEEFKAPESVKMGIITLSTDEEANKVLRRLRKGEDFTKVAKEVSLDRDNPDAGEFKYHKRGELPKEFEDVIFHIPLARASEVVKTSYGYNIFRVDEKIKARELNLKEAKEIIFEKLKKEKADKAFNDWIKNLKQNASIDIKEELL